MRTSGDRDEVSKNVQVGCSVRVEEIESSNACQSPGGRGQRDSPIMVKGLYFFESLPRLWLFSSCGGKED